MVKEKVSNVSESFVTPGYQNTKDKFQVKYKMNETCIQLKTDVIFNQSDN